jgi:hypothetical protein
MNRLVALVICLFCLVVPSLVNAGYTETLPAGAFMLDSSFSMSSLSRAWNNNGHLGRLIAPIERYEPGGGLQGILRPEVEVEFAVWITQLQFGILDNLSVGIGLPVVAYTDINVDFEWDPGDFQSFIGRPYSESDFWEWAESMGQPKPGDWRGNKWVTSDLVLGVRYRFSDYIPWCVRNGLGIGAMVTGNIRTSKPPDPEEVVSAGTTMWDLHSQGELGFHLSADKSFKKSLDGRFLVGIDLFYEFLFPQRLKTPTGERHPLMLNYEPYVGRTYRLDPGDFKGGSVLLEFVPVKGPEWGTWLVKGDTTKAASLPPLINVAVQYRFTHLSQSDWQSDSAIWDWEREKLWRPGYKNTLLARLTISLFRLGLPVQLYGAYRNQSWIPGKNTRAANVVMGGLRVLGKFW